MDGTAHPGARRRHATQLVLTAVLAVALLVVSPVRAPATAGTTPEATTSAVVAAITPSAVTAAVTAAETGDEPVLYRAVNLNGPAITVGGVAFEAGTAAGVSAGPRSFCNQGVPLVPATDGATATMVRCSVWGSGNPGSQVSLTGVPDGTYQVGVYVWEDNWPQTFTMSVNGSVVATNVSSGPAGTWQLLGPFEAGVTDGTLSVTTTGGSANLSGLVVHSGTGTPPPPVNLPPVVSGPGAQASTVGVAIAPVAVVASDPDAGQSLTFSATGLPAGLSLNATTGVVTGTPTTAGTSSASVTATDDGSPPLSASATFSWVVASEPDPDPDPDPDPEPGLYRAVNLNGPAITVGGIAFEAGTAAGVAAGPRSFCKQSVPLVPVTDSGTATMVRCSVWGSGNPGTQVSLTGVPDGTYQVGVYVWEDNWPQTFTMSVNGSVVATNVSSGPAGTWQLLGPFEAGVTDGTLSVTTTGGSANVSGLVVHSGSGTPPPPPPPPVNLPPVVTSPGAQASTVGVPIAPVGVVASDPDASQSLTFSATGLPAGLSLNASTGVVTGTPTVVGTSSASVTATDDGSPPLSASTTFSWVVAAAPGPDPDPSLPAYVYVPAGADFQAVRDRVADPDVLTRISWVGTSILTYGSVIGVSDPAAQLSDLFPAGVQVGAYAPFNSHNPSGEIDRQWVQTGWSKAGTATDIQFHATGSTGESATFTSRRTGTVVDVFYLGSGSDLTVSIDGGAPVTVPRSGLNKVDVYTVEGLADATHTVAVTSSGSTAWLVGADVRYPTGVVVRNFGWYGAYTEGWRPASAGSLWYQGLNAVESLGADIVLIQVGANEALHNLDIPTYRATLTNIVNEVKGWATPVLVHDIPNSDPDWPAVGAAMRAVADATGVPLVDLTAAWGGSRTGNESRYFDGVHPNAEGAGAIAADMYRALYDTTTAPPPDPDPDPDPGPDPEPGLYRAINLNGPAITAGGIAFEAGTAAGVAAGPRSFCNQSVPLVPVADLGSATMVRCSVWGSGNPGTQVSLTGVPDGTYQVGVYVWEDNWPQTFTMSVNGSVVATNASSGPAGTWQLLGPFEAGVTDGTLSVTTTGGSANVSGLVVYSGTGTPPPGNGVPSVTSPGAQSGTVGVAIAPVGVVASDPDASQSLTFSATGLPAGLSLNAATGVVTGTPTVVGTSSVTITATDNGTPPQSGSTTFTWTVTTGGSGGTGFDPTKVTDSFVAGGNWMKSLSADWLPDGTVLVLAEGGVVYRVNPVTGAQSVALDITAKVFLEGESGALDILVDQAGTGFYVYYTAADSDRLRISHFTLGSATETVIWNNPGLGYNAARAVHLGGALNFGPDGKLYLTVGDRYEGRSQDLTNVFGKVLRINADGTVPTDNPFYDGAGPNADEIWAYGFRNPYRASFDDVTGLFWVGDVGGNVDTNAYEEVNLVEAGRNYGWPLCEGPVSGPKNGPLCPSGVTGPVSYYSHAIGEGCCRNRAIVGGEVYRASAFPLAGHYLYLDYATNEVSWVELGPDGRTAVSTGLVTEVGSFTPVWLGVGPDGNVYWLSLGFGGNGQLRRLTYTGTVNRPPVITAASATPTIGAAPLAVVFTGAATDPDGTPVTYAWDFGDGGTSSAADPTHTYASSGTYQARLLVTSGGATVSSNPIAVVVGSPPTAQITGPPDGTVFDAGDIITVSGTAEDPDVGPLPPGALSWEIQFLHNDHAHPVTSGTGPSITLTVPTTGHDFTGDTRYLVRLTATDSDGLIGTTSITLRPNKAPVALTSNLATTVTVDSVTHTLPYTIDTVVGFEHVLSVPESHCVDGRLWTFQAWSDGGARTHTITAAPGLAPVATYADTGTCAATGPP